MGAAGFLITLTGLALATGAFGKSAPLTQAKQPGPKKKSPAGSAAKPSRPASNKNWIDQVNDFFEDRWNRRM